MDELRCKDSELCEVVYTAESPIHGTGLFARQTILEGEYIGTFWGPEVKRNGMHVLWIYHEDDTPVGRRGRNMLRFLNHATPGNSAFYEFDLYATEEIPEGTEITFDYGEEFTLE